MSVKEVNLEFSQRKNETIKPDKGAPTTISEPEPRPRATHSHDKAVYLHFYNGESEAPVGFEIPHLLFK